MKVPRTTTRNLCLKECECYGRWTGQAERVRLGLPPPGNVHASAELRRTLRHQNTNHRNKDPLAMPVERTCVFVNTCLNQTDVQSSLVNFEEVLF